MSVETHLLYAVHGPIVAALLVSEEENSIHTQKTLSRQSAGLAGGANSWRGI